MGSVRTKSKKRDRQTQRRRQAHTKVTLAVVAAVAQGFMQETQKNLSIMQPKHEAQVERVWRWSNACLNEIELGKHSLDSASRLLHQMDAEVQAIAPPGEEKTVGDYAVVWLMIGFLADEAKCKRPSREWNYLASVINTFAEMVLHHAPEDGTDYEYRAGELAERVWHIVFDKPREYFG